MNSVSVLHCIVLIEYYYPLGTIVPVVSWFLSTENFFFLLLDEILLLVVTLNRAYHYNKPPTPKKDSIILFNWGRGGEASLVRKLLTHSRNFEP